MQTDNLELKKLVYLYLMNYAKSQPDLAILAVNTFVKVCCVLFSKCPNPSLLFVHDDFQCFCRVFVDFGLLWT